MPLDPTTLITSLYAAICTVLLIGLGGRISIFRRRHKVGVGSGGHQALELAVRAHGNAVESIPLGLFLLLLFELNGAPPLAVHGFGAVFTAARVSHASGLSSSGGVTRRRFFGMALTWTSMLVLALILIAQYLMSLFA